MTDSMRQLELDAMESYREEYPNWIAAGDDASDLVHEIADGWVPIYTYDLMQLAASDTSLATDEPEIGPAFDGSPTPVNIVAANIYERLTAALYELMGELEAEDA